MKIKTIKMFRRTSTEGWSVKTRDSGDEGFICGTIWNKMFPRLRRRRKLTIIVHTGAVKGSKRFVLCHPKTAWMGFIQNQGMLYYQMELAITAILSDFDRVEMPVWVTFT